MAAGNFQAWEKKEKNQNTDANSKYCNSLIYEEIRPD